MPRAARIVVPHHPHHVTQRGSRNQQVFFDDGDYRQYRSELAEQCAKASVQVWAYCLMPNHVHLILTPEESDGLRRAVSQTHRRYARRINKRNDWRGHLWQERFFSVVMDEAHLLTAARYVALNPVRAGLVERAEEWPWSSLAAHRDGIADGLVSAGALARRIDDWDDFLRQGESAEAIARLRRQSLSGRPLGDEDFLDDLEAKLGRGLRRAKPGPKARAIHS